MAEPNNVYYNDLFETYLRSCITTNHCTGERSFAPSNIMTKYDGFNYDRDREIYSAARVRALESLLIEKGIISGETVR